MGIGAILTDWVQSGLDSTGNFSLDLQQGISKDWIVLLVDSNAADKRQKVAGFASLSFGTETMVALPTGDVNSSSLDLGTISPDSSKPDEIHSRDSVSRNATHFDLSLSQLVTLSGNDDMAKALKNVYINALNATHISRVLPRFSWMGMFPSDISQFADVNALMHVVPEYLLQFKSIDPDLTSSAIKNGTTHMEVVPPAPIDLADPSGSVLYPNVSTVPIDTQSAISDIDNRATYQTPYCMNKLPEGWWILKKDGQEYMVFDLSAAYAADDAGLPKMFVPSLRLVFGADSVLTSIEFKWYGYQNGGYIEQTDAGIIDKVIPSDFTLWIQPDEYHYHIVPSTSSITHFDNTWSVASGSLAGGAKRLTTICMSYSINGVDYNFGRKLR